MTTSGVTDGNTPTGESATPSFPGFTPLVANYVYCPNQFFDLCLTSKSRGVVRAVAYILRQTLGWLDANGEPLSQDIQVAYADLIKKARVSKGAIPKALQQAAALGFIECIRQGEAKTKDGSGQSALFRLRWDHRERYSRSFADFNGFYAGTGCRTPVPNAFFDHIIPNEKLTVVKTVGAIIRHTVGYENQFGGRRRETSLSLTDIQRYTNIGKRVAVIEALKHAEATGYLHRVEAGKFSSDMRQQTKSVYAIRWLGQAKPEDIAPKREPAEDHPKKGTTIGPKREPANHPKKGTSIEKTEPKDTKKQQLAEFLETIQQLEAEGFDQATATKLARSRGVDVVNRQLDWMPVRNPQKNRLGFLRKAIEEDWPAPEQVNVKHRRDRERQKEGEREAKRLAEESAALKKKQRRSERKQTLLAIWQELPSSDRQALIDAAATHEPSATLRDIICRQKVETDRPVIQVLDELAIEKSLPTVSTGVETKLSGDDSTADDRSASPQEIKSVTD